MIRKSVPAPPQRAGDGVVPPAQLPNLPAQPRQRRRGWLLLGVLVVAGGGVLGYHTVNGLTDRVPVLVVTRDVPLGQELTAHDVTTTLVGVDDLVATVPARELRRVIGMRAAVDLVGGMLVQPKLLTDRLTPLGGQQLVPVAVKPSRLPARGLRPGDSVLVVAAPDGQAVPTTKAAATPRIEAVVDQVKGPDTDGLMVVDLIVNGTEGADLAARAAEGPVAMVLNPRRT
ncbi:SAF domain-containing protein [Sphaerimonospora cavernae]|uniref:SAF domain-containing protein n=1 Tax=Sphaerimonospora cavernae TaxID=1740611 RepID=A0ABV6TXM6_9ACTN